MTETTTTPTLSPQTHACVQGLVRAKHEVEQWTHNLQQALADDVTAGRLTPEEAAEVAKTYEVKAPPPAEPPAEAHETTAEANQAQLDAHTDEAQAAQAKDAEIAAAAQPKPEPAPPPPKNDDDDKPPKAKHR